MSRFNWAKVDLQAVRPEMVVPRESPPEYDLRLLFFSGGTALAELSSALPFYSRNSRHVVTTFDSGGSSAALRRSFGMPAVGDLRARLISLARDPRKDAPDPARKALLDFWERRFSGPALFESGPASDDDLRDELARICKGEHPWLEELSPEQAGQFTVLLSDFFTNMPDDFHLDGACLGNLMLAGAWLRADRVLARAVELCAELIGAQGLVRPAGEMYADLAVRYASSRVVVGQHLFSAKQMTRASLENFAAEGQIRQLWFTSSLDSLDPMEVELNPEVAEFIADADLICYPMGSFYSSLLANLLPAGTGTAIADNPCPKIFIPNPGADPELLGHSLKSQVEALLAVTLKDAPDLEPQDVLDAVVVDSQNGLYPGGVPFDWLSGLGVAVLDYPFVLAARAQDNILRGDAHSLCRMLMSIYQETR